ncbi:MAG: glycosyltransferase family 4 protein [Actinobacteria bacterium]|nr:glycosyltransferase family 4 protein [Actinomycetota bacterium]
MPPTIALDLRYLEAAYRNSPGGGLGGMGVYSRGLWHALARKRPDWGFLAVGDRGLVPSLFRETVDASTAAATIVQRGLAGSFPFPLRLAETRCNWLLHMLESELGWGNPLSGLPTAVDVLHGLSQLPPARSRKTPTVTTVYDLIPLGAAGNSTPSGLARVRRRYLARIGRADRFLCISESTRRDLLSLTDICPSRVRVVYPGIEHATFRPVHCTPDELRDRYGIEPPYFLNVGVCFGRKNPRALLDAFSRVVSAREGREASLAFVGPYHVIPGSAQRIEREANALHIADRVKVIGDVGEDHLARLYTNAAALVFPSLYEGFGYPALESLACGTPAIVSAASSLPEAVGPLGRLVDPRDPADIARAMSDRLRELPAGRLDVEGPEWARRFSWEKTASACVEVYEDLLS